MTREEITATLSAFDSLKGMNVIDRSRIAGAGTPLVCRTERALFYQGDPADRTAIVLDGRIDLVKYRSDGTSVIMRSAQAGEWIGLAETITAGPYLTDAVTRSESSVLIFTRDRFMPLMSLGGIKDSVLTMLARGYYDVYSQLDARSPVEKISAFLRSRAELSGGGETIIEITQEALAEAIGYTRETVNKTLAALASDGAVTLSRGKIVVTDVKRLDASE
ncbi:MAG: Crp/Fnr family transcriptional regulator [Spirochaetes bacterium]|nr:Crp/Fnr family transcriptional regulator [Spirochaetota bacterium]